VSSNRARARGHISMRRVKFRSRDRRRGWESVSAVARVPHPSTSARQSDRRAMDAPSRVRLLEINPEIANQTTCSQISLSSSGPTEAGSKC
jgi:hypothetical protein